MPKRNAPTAGIKDFANFPHEAQDYVKYIEESVGVPVEIISNGPAREEVFYRNE